MFNKIIVGFILISCFSLKIYSEEKHVEIGIEHDKKLGKMIPLDIVFTNSENKKFTLKELVTKPTVLSLVYYHCPGICSPLLTNLGKVIDQSDLIPGKDYNVLSISFDARETWDVAQKWKSNYIKGLNKEVEPSSWQFMVGDSNNVNKLTEAVGFYYKSDGQGDFIHSGALIVLSPDGKITRYLLGTDYLPFDFKMAIIESSKGIATPPISKFLAYCFKYDPNGKKYIFNINRVAGTLIFLSAGLFLTILIIKGRSKKASKGV